MKNVTLADVLAVSDTDRNTFNYLKRAELLRSKIGATRPGVHTELKRRTALEIVFISALAGAGLKLSEASERANSEFFGRIKDHREGELFYAINPRTSFGFFFTDAQISLAILRNQLADARSGGWTHEPPEVAPSVFSIVDVGELIRRVDRLFDVQRPND